MTRPYELLVRFDSKGGIAGASIKTITTVDGRDYESDPSPLSGADDPVFAAFADQFAATAVTERDEEKAAHEITQRKLGLAESERDALQVKLDSMSAHPDVIAAEKARAIAHAKEKRAKAIAEKEAAETALAEFESVKE